MMPNADFQKLRLDLDDTITYEGNEKARFIAQAALDLAVKEKNKGEALYFSAQLSMLDEDFELAILHLTEAIRINPKDGAAYNDLALCKVEAGKLDEALKLFDEGISAEPDFATIHHNKGWLLNKIGHYEKAITSFHNALAFDPKRSVTYENLADTYASLNRKEDALAACQKALTHLKPGCDDIRRQLEDKLKEFQG